MNNAELLNKLILNGGTLDTKNYRYRINTQTGKIERCKLEYLDRTMPLHFERWQTANKRYQDLF